MPTAPASPCAHPGCPGRAVKHGRCTTHAAQLEQSWRERYPDHRTSSSARGYGSEWERVRRAFLAKHKWCTICDEAGVRKLATDVDHIVPRVKGGTDDASNLQALCHEHHSRKTASIDRLGGWNSRNGR